MRAVWMLVLLACSGTARVARADCTEGQNGILDRLSGNATASGCLTCTPDGEMCLECFPFFGLSSAGDCLQCAPPGLNATNSSQVVCSACSGDGPGICTDCSFSPYGPAAYYANIEGECLPCPAAGCVSCRNINGTCLECERGMGLASNGTCTACAPELAPACIHCDADSARCSLCEPGTFPSPANGTCVRCPAGCKECAAGLPPNATPSNGTSSTNAPSNASSNGAPSGGVAPGDQAVAETQPSTETGVMCTLCEQGLSADAATGRCVPCADPQCAICTAGPSNCDFCTGAGGPAEPVGGVCLKCTDLNCFSCKATSLHVCDSCKKGYGNDPAANGTCVPCKIAGCGSCDRSGLESCELCSQGYLDVDTGNCRPCKTPECAACDVVEGAETCTAPVAPPAPGRRRRRRLRSLFQT